MRWPEQEDPRDQRHDCRRIRAPSGLTCTPPCDRCLQLTGSRSGCCPSQARARAHRRQRRSLKRTQVQVSSFRSQRGQDRMLVLSWCPPHEMLLPALTASYKLVIALSASTVSPCDHGPWQRSRVIDSKSGKQISLELDRNGKKFVASLSPRHVHVVSTRGEAAIDVGTPEGKYSTLSMSSLNDPDTPFVNRVGTGSSSVKVEHLQAKCKVISCCP